MSMEKHLKSHLYYSDLYDRHTVDKCRRINNHSDTKDDAPSLKGKGVSKKQAEQIRCYINKFALYIEVGERYINKEKTIREWMDADQKKDELYESADPPEDIRCLMCRNSMKPTFKELWTGEGKKDRVLYIFDCPNKCTPRRAFFSDGEEWRTKSNLCPHCDGVLKREVTDDGKKQVITRTCLKCKYYDTDEYVWSHNKKEKIDENYAADRDRFCLSEEEGKKYEHEKWKMEQMGEFADEWKEKQKQREEKLLANPEGFHLEGGGYSCSICGGNTPEGDNWYDKYGVKCLVCQKAIDEGEIPASLAKNKDSWYSKWEIERAFNIKSPTIERWVREGVLNLRTVSLYGKGVHFKMFLIKDNKDFLPPKKLVESCSVKEVKDGKVWFHSEPWYMFVDPVKHLKGYRIMDYLRVMTPEEVVAQEEEKKRKAEQKQARKGTRKKR